MFWYETNTGWLVLIKIYDFFFVCNVCWTLAWYKCWFWITWEVATSICDFIFSILFRDLIACRLDNIPTPPIVILPVFPEVDVDMNVHPYPSSWYFRWISCQYSRWSCTFILSIWYVTAIAISYDICLMDWKLRTMNVDTFMVISNLSSCLLFHSVTNLSKSGARIATPARDLIWPRDDQCGMSFWFEVES